MRTARAQQEQLVLRSVCSVREISTRVGMANYISIARRVGINRIIRVPGEV